jgi:hypothetical protein
MSTRPSSDYHIHDNADENEASDPSKFNAANYLFLSTKMAKLYPELRVAQIIREFSTPWPKQSYHRATNVNKEYDRRFDAITKSITMILMFFVTSFISIPQSVQDMVIHMCTTAVSGYTALLHVRLYRIYPVLVVVPTLLLAAVVHFIVQSNKMKEKIEFARVFDINNSHNEPIELGEQKSNVESSDRHEVSSSHLNRRQSIVQGIKVASMAQRTLMQFSKDDESNDMILSDEDESVYSDSEKLFQAILNDSEEYSSSDGKLSDDGDDVSDVEILTDLPPRVSE